MNANEYKLLIVDDDPLVRKGVQRFLDQAGFHVQTAADGFEALSLLHRAVPDLMLLDLEMPGISGLELLHLLAQDNIQPPTVVLTARPSVNSALEAGQLKVVDYFVKPLTKEMIGRIEEILNDEAAPDAGRSVEDKLRAILKERGLSERIFPTVISLYSGGGTNRRIGQELGISWSTVRSHLRQAMTAFDVSSRDELVTAIIQAFSKF
ncbi:MAG: response regulator transcription factor [Proteobacteria bacterium]|nr:response regulator transcription factor [Pseudomonadota bacterium]